MKLRYVCVALLGGLASACSSMPSLPGLPGFLPETSASTGAPASAAREHVSSAVELLGSGNEAEARVHLQAALAKNPGDAVAQLLLRQIETDPVQLLGEATTTYVVQPGDTMSALADRFLGDHLMFYALSRYNSLAAPNAISVGRTLKMPPPAAAALTSSNQIPKLNTPAAKAASATRANAMRLQALQMLNTGDVHQAVTLLREAVSLDETDLAIRRDLERAERIQNALKAG